MSASTFADASLSREAQRFVVCQTVRLRGIGGVSALPLTMLTNASSDFDLTIRQQPDRARVAGGKEKERKPIDPPPIVQLRVREEGSYLAQ